MQVLQQPPLTSPPPSLSKFSDSCHPGGLNCVNVRVADTMLLSDSAPSSSPPSSTVAVAAIITVVVVAAVIIHIAVIVVVVTKVELRYTKYISSRNKFSD
jgi:hypothetical protein